MSAELSRMAAATLLASFAGPDVPDWLRRRVDGGLGGVCLFGSNLRPDLGPPLARGTGHSADAGAAANPPAPDRGAGAAATSPPSAGGPGSAATSLAGGPSAGATPSVGGRSPAGDRGAPRGRVGARAGDAGVGDTSARVAEAGVVAAARVSAALHAVRPSVVVALDEEGGDVTRLEAHVGSSVPGNAALGAADDAALTRRLAHGLGLRLAGAGVDLDLAPCADANTDPANPVIGVRSFGADPALVARHVAAFVEGLQAAGVAACAKHFPGHGATTVDSHLDLPVVDASAPVLRARELVPFRAAIGAGASAVMLGHLRMPAFDHLPATISRPIATGLLRDELGFGGAVVTDALDMHGIGGPPAIPANVVRAVAAGADLCCLGSEGTDELIGACIDALVGAVRRGDLDGSRLADAAARVAAIRRRPPGGAAVAAEHRSTTITPPPASGAGPDPAAARADAAPRATAITQRPAGSPPADPAAARADAAAGATARATTDPCPPSGQPTADAVAAAAGDPATAIAPPPASGAGAGVDLAGGDADVVEARGAGAAGGRQRTLVELGAEAAWRALRIEGDLFGGVGGPAHVVELRSVPNIAAGVVPWGVAAELTEIDPRTTSEQLDPAGAEPAHASPAAPAAGGDGARPPLTGPGPAPGSNVPASPAPPPAPDVPVAGALARAQGRPLVVVLRDGRRAATARLVAALVAARPDAIVVDMGWPSAAGPEPAAPPEIAAGDSRAGAHVSTYGASRVSGEAVARLLAGRDAPASLVAPAAPRAGRSPRG
jgi:beta-N-acetylhexosaminidase